MKKKESALQNPNCDTHQSGLKGSGIPADWAEAAPLEALYRNETWRKNGLKRRKLKENQGKKKDLLSCWRSIAGKKSWKRVESSFLQGNEKNKQENQVAGKKFLSFRFSFPKGQHFRWRLKTVTKVVLRSKNSQRTTKNAENQHRPSKSREIFFSVVYDRFLDGILEKGLAKEKVN